MIVEAFAGNENYTSECKWQSGACPITLLPRHTYGLQWVVFTAALKCAVGWVNNSVLLLK